MELNFDLADEPVNKEHWSQDQKDIVQEARIIASKNDYLIYYIQTNTDSQNQWKEISSKIIKEKHGLCIVCSHNPSGFKWIFSSLSKEFSKLFSETRHFPIDIEDTGAPKTFIDFLEKIKVSTDATATSIRSQVSNAFDEFSLQIHDELTVNVFEALKVLSDGFISEKHNKLSLSNETLNEIRESVFTILYRIIFVLYAEDRGIFPIDNPIYYDEFSIKWIKQELLLKFKKINKLKEYEVQKRLSNLFHLIEVGSEELDYSSENFYMKSYYGRLFAKAAHPKLASWKISNKHLLEALSFLTRTRDAKRNYFFLDYSALETRHLGAIYERLLEFHLEAHKGKIVDLPDPIERKASGSYYTPKYIVDYVVQHSIEPHIQKIIQENPNVSLQIEKILSLKILDPAMGSGHFLVGVIEYLAKRLCEIEFEEKIEQNQYEIRKRDVVRKCIYGVDVNPLAVDLAKLSLWLETLKSDKPLSFLNAHLKHGNSLVGELISSVFDAQQSLFETKTMTHFKKTVKDFLGFESFEDDTASAVKAKVEKYDQMISKGTFYHQLRGLLDHKLTESFGKKVHPWRDLRQKIGVESLDFYSSKDGVSVNELRNRIGFFHWELEFPEIFYNEKGEKKSNPGFDIILGNPPYVSARAMSKAGMDDQKSFFKNKNYYSTPSGVFDLYIVFMEKGIKLLKNDGSLGFIISNKFMIDDYGKEIRKFLLNNTKINEIIDVSKEDVFADAAVYPHILIFTKQNDQQTYNIKTQNGLKNKLFENQIPVELFKELSDNIFVIHFIGGEFDLIKKIMKSGESLEKFCEMHAGTTGFSASNIAKCIVDGNTSKPCVDFIVTGNIDRYQIKMGNVRYLNKKYENPKLILDKNLITEGKIGLFTSPKIVIGGMTTRIEAAYDKQGTGIGVNVYAVTDPKLNEYYLLGLLNSKLLSFYFSIINQAKHLAGEFFAINKGQLAKLPIKSYNGTNSLEKMSKEVLELCDDLIKSRDPEKLLLFVKALRSKKQFLNIENILIKIVKIRIDEDDNELSMILDDVIDQIVYILYQLTDNEIVLVEKKFSS